MSSKRKPTSAFSLFVLIIVAASVQVLTTLWSAAEEPPRDSATPGQADARLPQFEPLQSQGSLPSAEPLANKAQPRRQAAVASDLDPAAEVARELLHLQQQLGGSIVTDRPELEGWIRPSAPVTSRSAPAPVAQPQRQMPPPWSDYPPPRSVGGTLATTGLPNLAITELREAAWQLVTTAHRLEELDLYEQADALRTLADRLRQDARGMKQAERAVQAESVSATTP